jgi:hypothetical protein
MEVGSEGNIVWSARCGALCAQETRFLECTRLHVKADSSQRREGWLFRLMGLAPNFKLGDLIVDDDAAWRQLVSSLVCTPICCILLVASLLRAWFYYRV